MTRLRASREHPFADLRASVVVSVRGRTFREALASSWILTRAGAIAASAAVVITAVVLLALLVPQGRRADSASAAIAAQLREPGPVGGAAAYRYPVSCLSVEFASTNRSYARARLDRASPCWRYGVWVTAVFHRVDGVWHRVLDAASYSCPVRSLPRGVERQLGVCA